MISIKPRGVPAHNLIITWKRKAIGSQQVNEGIEEKGGGERWLNWWPCDMNQKPIRINDSVRWGGT